MNMSEIKNNGDNDVNKISDEKVNKDENLSAEDVLGPPTDADQPIEAKAEPEEDIEVLDTLLMEDEMPVAEDEASSMGDRIPATEDEPSSSEAADSLTEEVPSEEVSSAVSDDVPSMDEELARVRELAKQAGQSEMEKKTAAKEEATGESGSESENDIRTEPEAETTAAADVTGAEETEENEDAEEAALEEQISRSLKALTEETAVAAKREQQRKEEAEAAARAAQPVEVVETETEAEVKDKKDYDYGSLNEPVKKRKKTGFWIGGIAAFLLIVYLGGAFYFQNHFAFGTVVNGMKVAGRTAEQVEDDMAGEVASYILTLEQRGDVTKEIHASEIGLEFVSDGEVQKLLDGQNAFKWPIALFENADADLHATVSYDEDKLDEAFQGLDALNTDKATEPVNAYPEYSESEGAFVIVEEVYGNLVKEEELYALLDPAITNGVTSISLDEENCYVDPEYTAESTEVINATEELNKYVSSEITYEFGDDIEYLGSDEINKWLTVSEDWEVKIDEELVREFVDYIGSTYNTIGKTRHFTTTGGSTIEITSGDYGWNLKRDEETEELIEAIKEGYQGVREPNYHRTAAQYGEQDWGDTYVEISIDQQRMWFYKDGQLLVDTPVVTGDVTRTYQGKSRATPTGIFMVTYVDEDAVLTGENYASPVKYWMPFYYNVGIHDASWRSSFGGNIYKGNGSHGCINTPEAAAKTIHDNIEAWDPVIVY